MGVRHLLRLCGALALLCGLGCENDIDSDSLVRELRVLSLRIGPQTPQSDAEAHAEVKPGPGGLDLVFTQPTIDLKVEIGAPTGPGRRFASPRPLAVDWFLCVGPSSLFNPGTLDPGCRKWLPTDPDPMKSTALRFLGNGETFPLPTAVLKEVVGGVLQIMLTGGSGGGSGGTIKLPEKPVMILLPVLARVRVVGGDPNDNRDSEVAVTYLRTWVALPGMTLPAANHNPSVGELLAGPDQDGAKKPLLPCIPTSCPANPVKRNQDLFLIASALAGSVENYTPQDDSGRGDRPETLRYSWFATDGNFEKERTGDAFPDNKWNSDSKRPPPDGATQGSLWLVVQDERGGTDARRYELSFQN